MPSRRKRRTKTIATPPIAAPDPQPAWLAPGVGVLVTLAAAVIYVGTAARDVVVGDTTELITAAVTLGVAHAPGYPLFTMLGHLASLIPLGPLPFRVNLTGALFDALAVGVVFATAVELTGSVV